jgi:hypothetical protein
MGPSIASLESVTAGAYKEVRTALEVVLRAPGFALTAGATLLLSAVAARLAHRQRWEADGRSGLLFLVLLLPASAAVLDAAGLHGFARLAGPEARVSVPWLSHLEMMKASLNQLVMPGAQARDAQPVRSALGVAPAFRTEAGVAVLIIGESLRADALLRPGRGPGSAELQRRLDDGLGVRLPDACAGGNGTFIAVPKLLTAAPAEAPPPTPTAPACWRWPGRRRQNGLYQQPRDLGHARGRPRPRPEDLVHRDQQLRRSGHRSRGKLHPARRRQPQPGHRAASVWPAFLLRRPLPERALRARAGAGLAHRTRRAPLPACRRIRRPGAGSRRADARRAANTGLPGVPPATTARTSSDHNGKRFHAGPVNSRPDTLVPALVLWNRAFAQSGRQHRLEALQGTALITHHDLARAWLALLGAPGRLTPAAEPMTWGSVTAGLPAGPLRCGDLPP